MIITDLAYLIAGVISRIPARPCAHRLSGADVDNFDDRSDHMNAYGIGPGPNAGRYFQAVFSERIREIGWIVCAAVISMDSKKTAFEIHVGDRARDFNGVG